MKVENFFHGNNGSYDFGKRVWMRSWQEPTLVPEYAIHVFKWVRDQTVYRKIAGNTSPIYLKELIERDGVFVGRWLDRHDSSMQVLVNNLWLVAVENHTYRQQYISERFVNTSTREYDPRFIVLELSGRARSMRELPSPEQVVAGLGRGILADR